MWQFITQLVKQSEEKLVLLIGSGFILASFCEMSKQSGNWAFSLTHSPNWFLLVPGIVLLFFFLWYNRTPKLGSARVVKIDNGFSLNFDSDHTIEVIFGEIQALAPEKHGAIVLPANTTFDETCISDERSALGSFFLHHFPGAIPEMQSRIRDMAAEACGIPLAEFVEAPPGMTLILRNPMGTDYTVMLTAVTVVDPEKGIIADTTSLLSGVKEIFSLASHERLSKLAMPVMGTGHGGLDLKAALLRPGVGPR